MSELLAVAGIQGLVPVGSLKTLQTDPWNCLTKDWEIEALFLNPTQIPSRFEVAPEALKSLAFTQFCVEAGLCQWLSENPQAKSQRPKTTDVMGILQLSPSTKAELGGEQKDSVLDRSCYSNIYREPCMNQLLTLCFTQLSQAMSSQHHKGTGVLFYR